MGSRSGVANYSRPTKERAKAVYVLAGSLPAAHEVLHEVAGPGERVPSVATLQRWVADPAIEPDAQFLEAMRALRKDVVPNRLFALFEQAVAGLHELLDQPEVDWRAVKDGMIAIGIMHDKMFGRNLQDAPTSPGAGQAYVVLASPDLCPGPETSPGT